MIVRKKIFIFAKSRAKRIRQKSPHDEELRDSNERQETVSRHEEQGGKGKHLAAPHEIPDLIKIHAHAGFFSG